MSKTKLNYIIAPAIILASLTGLIVIFLMLSSYADNLNKIKNNATQYEIHIHRKNLKLNQIYVTYKTKEKDVEDAIYLDNESQEEQLNQILVDHQIDTSEEETFQKLLKLKHSNYNVSVRDVTLEQKMERRRVHFGKYHTVKNTQQTVITNDATIQIKTPN